MLTRCCWLKKTAPSCISHFHDSGAWFSRTLVSPHPSAPDMATAEQFQMLLQQNAQFLQQMQSTQHDAMKQLLETIATKSGGGGAVGLDERKFREIGNFEGSEENWKEFSLKFKCVIKENHTIIFEAMKWAEKQDSEIVKDDIEL